MLKLCSPSPNNPDNVGNPFAESDDALRFLNSLKELKELRSQIHYAADHCEKTFLSAHDKATVLDNTKEYLCRAVVTVVDHLGSVSANLNRRIETTDTVSETELRINSLKQKLDSCDQYNQNFTLTKICWSTDLRRYYPRYISPPTNLSSKDTDSQLREAKPNDQPCNDDKNAKHEFKIHEDVPLFMYTSFSKIKLNTSSTSPLDISTKGTFGSTVSVVPVRDGIPMVPKLVRNPSFHFQENGKISGIRRILRWKSVDENEVATVSRRSKRERLRLLLKLKS